MVVIYSASVVGHRLSRSSSSGPSAGDGRFFFFFFVASAFYVPRRRAPSRAVRNLHTKYSYRKPASRRSARLNANSGKRKRASVSETVLERAAATVENRKTEKRPVRSVFLFFFVGVRLGSVSRLRQLITIGELSTELCLSCVRDITADARRTRGRSTANVTFAVVLTVKRRKRNALRASRTNANTSG